MFWKTLLEYGSLWFIGGSIYYTLERIFRGFSHWSMFVLGGICLMFFAFQGKASNWSEVLWKQVLRCTLFVISCEFMTGLLVNKWLNWGVWDYSNQPFHIFGQICLTFALVFAVLSAVGIVLSGYLLHWIFGEKKPKYRLL